MRNFLFITIYIGFCFFSVYTGINDHTSKKLILGVSLSLWFSAIPAIMVLLYGIGARIRYRDRLEKILYAASSAYFLGYMGTIASILSLMFILSQRGLENINDLILQSVCVALTTTMAGLIVMFLLKMYSQTLFQDILEPVKKEILENIREETDSIKKSMVGFSAGMGQATKQITTFKDDFHELSLEIQKASKPIIEISRKLEEAAPRLEKALKTFSDISEIKLSKDVIEGLKGGLEGLHDANKGFAALNPTLEKVQGSLRGLDNKVKIFGSSVQQSKDELGHFNAGVKEVEKILSDFAKLKEKILEEEEGKRKEQSDGMEHLSGNIEKLTQAVETFEEEKDKGEKQLQGMKHLSGNIDSLTQEVKTFKEEKDKWKKRFQEMEHLSENIEDLTQAVKTFKEKKDKWRERLPKTGQHQTSNKRRAIKDVPPEHKNTKNKDPEESPPKRRWGFWH